MRKPLRRRAGAFHRKLRRKGRGFDSDGQILIVHEEPQALEILAVMPRVTVREE
jgi:hypothetical protein